jgi:protein TonB
MSPARLWAIVFVAIFHVIIGYVFVTGFYQKFTKEGLQDLDVFDVEEAPPPEEEPPPPDEPVPEVQSPQVVAPPPLVQPPPRPQQQMQTVQEQPYSPPTARADTQGVVAPQPRQTFSCPGTGQVVFDLSQCRPPEPQYKQCPGGQRVLESAACPTPSAPPQPARLQNPGAISNDDYPSAALRAEAQGTTRITMQVGANGRVTGCTVSGSSGNSALDSTACRLAQSRFRFTPATKDGQPVAATASTSIRWVLPDN